jgi:hypothetical protein
MRRRRRTDLRLPARGRRCPVGVEGGGAGDLRVLRLLGRSTPTGQRRPRAGSRRSVRRRRRTGPGCAGRGSSSQHLGVAVGGLQERRQQGQGRIQQRSVALRSRLGPLLAAVAEELAARCGTTLGFAQLWSLARPEELQEDPWAVRRAGWCRRGLRPPPPTAPRRRRRRPAGTPSAGAADGDAEVLSGAEAEAPDGTTLRGAPRVAAVAEELRRQQGQGRIQQRSVALRSRLGPLRRARSRCRRRRAEAEAPDGTTLRGAPRVAAVAEELAARCGTTLGRGRRRASSPGTSTTSVS